MISETEESPCLFQRARIFSEAWRFQAMKDVLEKARCAQLVEVEVRSISQKDLFYMKTYANIAMQYSSASLLMLPSCSLKFSFPCIFSLSKKCFLFTLGWELMLTLASPIVLSNVLIVLTHYRLHPLFAWKKRWNYLCPDSFISWNFCSS